MISLTMGNDQELAIALKWARKHDASIEWGNYLGVAAGFDDDAFGCKARRVRLTEACNKAAAHGINEGTARFGDGAFALERGRGGARRRYGGYVRRCGDGGVW